MSILYLFVCAWANVFGYNLLTPELLLAIGFTDIIALGLLGASQFYTGL